MATMLNTNSLQPPKTGTSRWSKALPDVPGPNDPSFYDDYYEEASPRLPPAKELPPPPPPPRSTSIGSANAKSLPPSLPPLHLLSVNLPPSGPPKMAIPRRPIGKLSANPPTLPQKESQLPSPLQTPPSPSDSLSSILSAYSRSSGESLVRSPDETNSITLRSDANTSPSHQVPPANTKTGTLESAPTRQHHFQQQHHQQYDAPKLPVKQFQPLPLPSKDIKYHLPASPAPIRKPVPEKKSPELNSPSSQQQQPQLWRRRSSKADRGIELPDLTLVSSHGSTAATQPTVAQPPPVQQQPPSVSTAPTWQPGSTNPAAPAGQDVRQTPAAEQVLESPTMGSSSSKLNRLKDRLQFHRRGKSSTDTTKSLTQRPGAHRPPTPEYQKEDIKTPIVDSIVSPLSPASSPEPVVQVSPELPDDIPQISPQHQNQEPLRNTGSITRKAIPAPKLSSSEQDKPLSESWNLKNESPSVGSLPSSLTDSKGSRGPSSSDTAVHQVQPLVEVPSRFPPRDSSARSNALPRQLSAEHDPRLVSSDSQGPLYRGRYGTLYPEMKVMQEYDPQVAYFPKLSETPIAEGTIFKAPPLKKSHFSCYHGHKTMNRRTNRYYPLTCQTCDRSDVEDRWTCTFCHLRICEPCVKKLHNNSNDLRCMVNSLQLTA
ncbi:hypothetical protein FVEN_g10702 [Fusarium venenatum]|uniref:Uncharacterized protein n=1 Tax=Fusarium venenatum TaxID=56646 RepID=A0A2L2SQM5_9HYPO|nr:uncharacterized protein FVRRES_11792 [Fusarium venenatum]KAG8351162.1 hypothetical protein FVEN_g10702 [Fusarium venenatum]KAH6978456.1 hypothetical protein EDB82DRAFT_223503 [Fusarium venenatum]CEI39101.1 unnamed protein product [Fusarium venenatum]